MTPEPSGAPSSSRGDWRPPTDADWRRLRTLLRDVMLRLQGDAEQFEQAEQDLRSIGDDQWSIGISRYPDRAEMCCVLASWVDQACQFEQGVDLGDLTLATDETGQRNRQVRAAKLDVVG